MARYRRGGIALQPWKVSCSGATGRREAFNGDFTDSKGIFWRFLSREDRAALHPSYKFATHISPNGDYGCFGATNYAQVCVKLRAAPPFRAPGEPTDRDYFLAMVKLCKERNLIFENVGNPDDAGNRSDDNSGWYVLVGEGEQLEDIFHNPPSFFTVAEVVHSARESRGMGESRLTDSVKKKLRDMVREGIDHATDRRVSENARKSSSTDGCEYRYVASKLLTWGFNGADIAEDSPYVLAFYRLQQSPKKLARKIALAIRARNLSSIDETQREYDAKDAKDAKKAARRATIDKDNAISRGAFYSEDKGNSNATLCDMFARENADKKFLHALLDGKTENTGEVCNPEGTDTTMAGYAYFGHYTF